MVYTVGELAEKVRRPGEDMPALLARLRNWTKEGLLVPEGDRNPGAGRSRVYPEKAVAIARALGVLADVVGVAAVKSRSFDFFVKFAAQMFAKPPTADLFMIISRPLSGDGGAVVGGVKLEALADLLKNSKYPAHILVDVKKYFEQLQSED
jgi:hypothetical protein